jgi:hypothetical protein
VEFARQRNEMLPVLRINVRRVDDRQQPALQTLAHNVVQKLERLL